MIEMVLAHKTIGPGDAPDSPLSAPFLCFYSLEEELAPSKRKALTVALS